MCLLGEIMAKKLRKFFFEAQARFLKCVPQKDKKIVFYYSENLGGSPITFLLKIFQCFMQRSSQDSRF